MLKPILILASALSIVSCTTTEDISPSQELKVEKTEPSIKDFTVDEAGNVKFAIEVVYFEFDTYTLTDAGIQQLSALSEYLKKTPNKTLTIEGHADNRGSNEYNLALGESRAYAVHRFLTDTGIQASRLKTLTFGEERPAQDGSGEEAWAKNRRCEFTIADHASNEVSQTTASH